MYEAREQDEILKELQTNTGGDVSKFEGTFEYDVLASNSIEFSKQEIEREQMYKAAFARTSWGKYLDYRAEEHGIFRRIAVRALSTVTVTGTGVINQGSLFGTVSGILFHALKTTVVNGSASVDVEAEVAGAAGNVAAGTITSIPMSIPGISGVTNPAAAYDGFDEEDDASLYNRLIFKVRQPATSGNVNHYMEWCLGISGVGKVVVKPLWAGNGTVKVIIIDSNGDPASDHLLQQVRDYLAIQTPIGATVTVVAPTILVLTIALTPTKGKGDIEGIKSVLTAYFTSSEYDGTKISYAKIGEVILKNQDVTKVNDYDDLTINGQNDNIPVTDEQIPQVTEVVLHG